MAWPISSAWWASSTIVTAARSRVSDSSVAMVRSESRLGWRKRRSVAANGSRPGRAIVSTTNTATTAIAGALPSPMAMASSSTLAGAISVRRRLSNIFQRPANGTLARPASPEPSRPRPRIHGSSCQSPRAQRCWRAAATS
jgi:hypothetical protein